MATTENEQDTLIETTLRHIDILAEANVELNGHAQALDAFKLISQLALTESGIQRTLDLSHQTQCWPIILRTLSREYETLSARLSALPNEKKLLPNIADIDLAAVLVSIMRMFSNSCINFCQFLIESDGIDLLFKFLQQESLIIALLNSHDDPGFSLNGKEIATMLEIIVRGILGTLIHLGKVYCTTKSIWRKVENKAVQTLFQLSIRLEKILDCQFAAYIALALITDDQDEVVQMPFLCRVIGRIATLTGDLCKLLSNDSKSVQRIPMHMNVNDDSYHEAAVIWVDGVQWNVVELLNALYRMAVNDKIKRDIYEKYDLSRNIRIILYKGTVAESAYAAKLLWQLCFDASVAASVRNDPELIARIEYLNHYSSYVYLKQNCGGILWQVNHETNPPITTSTNSDSDSKSEQHIMISYNSGSRASCLRIKQELESQGHRVWIDVESIHGSSLESMANAIENSWCVLMCMTENYKQSTNCRAEAEYAFQLKKPIIPLVMQKDYKPDGWLGIILGSKIFVNFTRYEFIECMTRLKAELDQIKSSTSAAIVVANILTRTTPSPPLLCEINSITKINPLDWGEPRVEKWLRETNIHTSIQQSVAPCDGKLLAEMYEIMNSAPDFFFTSISAPLATAELTQKIPPRIRDVARFSLELKNLFKN